MTDGDGESKSTNVTLVPRLYLTDSISHPSRFKVTMTINPVPPFMKDSMKDSMREASIANGSDKFRQLRNLFIQSAKQHRALASVTELTNMSHVIYSNKIVVVLDIPLEPLDQAKKIIEDICHDDTDTILDNTHDGSFRNLDLFHTYEVVCAEPWLLSFVSAHRRKLIQNAHRINNWSKLDQNTQIGLLINENHAKVVENEYKWKSAVTTTYQKELADSNRKLFNDMIFALKYEYPAWSRCVSQAYYNQLCSKLILSTVAHHMNLSDSDGMLKSCLEPFFQLSECLEIESSSNSPGTVIIQYT